MNLIVEKIPAYLKQQNIWLLWAPVPNKDNKTFTKVPYKLHNDIAGNCLVKCDYTKEHNTFDDVEAARMGWLKAVETQAPVVGKRGPTTPVYLGVTNLASVGLIAFDMDKCVNAQTRVVHPQVLDLVQRLDSYTEITPSGTGLRTFLRATVPAETRRKTPSSAPLKIELFHNSGFVTVTGDHLQGTPQTINEYVGELDELLIQLGLFTPEPAVESSTPVLLHPMAELQDDQLLNNMAASKQGETVKAFFVGGEPADTLYETDPSAGDFHFARMLLWWNNGNTEQTERLMRRSCRVRDKWDRHHHGRENPPYLRMTIQKARESMVSYKGSFDDLLLTFVVRKTVPEDFTYDTLGFANRFAMLHAGDVISDGYDFYAWNGIYWKKTTPPETMALLISPGQYVLDNEIGATNEKHNTALRKLVARYRNSSGLKDLRACIAVQRDIYVPQEQFDNDFMLIPFLNGVYNLETDEFLSHVHTKQRYLTHVLPYEYNPDAECPKWKAFLEKITGGAEEFGAFLQYLAGMCITSVIVKEFYMIVGPKDTGKSTFLAVLAAVLGNYASSVDSSLLAVSKYSRTTNQATELVHLDNRRMVYVSEISSAYTLNEPMLKQFTGGDTVLIRELYRSAKEIPLKCTFLMHGNSVPAIRGIDDAIWERIVVIPFDNVVVSKDEPLVHGPLSAYYQDEFAGILSWMVAGARRFVANNCAPPKLPEAMQKMRNEIRQDANSVDQFINESTLLGTGYTPLNDLWNAYRHWCKVNDFGYAGKYDFSNALREHRCEVGKRIIDEQGRKIRVVAGITLRDPFDNVQIKV